MTIQEAPRANTTGRISSCTRTVTRFAAAGILAVGAVAYACLVGTGTLTFLATPLLLGTIALTAGVLGHRRRLLPNALVLVGWGAAVLAAEYLLPNGREAPAYMLGIAIGIATARLVSRPEERTSWFTAAAVTATIGSIAFYLAYDLSWLGGWEPWALTTLAWAANQARPTTEPGTARPGQ